MTIFDYTPVIVITLNITEHYIALLQKPQGQPLEVFCKRSCSYWSLILIMLQVGEPAALLITDSNTSAFLRNL